MQGLHHSFLGGCQGLSRERGDDLLGACTQDKRGPLESSALPGPSPRWLCHGEGRRLPWPERGFKATWVAWSRDGGLAEARLQIPIQLERGCNAQPNRLPAALRGGGRCPTRAEYKIGASRPIPRVGAVHAKLAWGGAFVYGARGQVQAWSQL